MILELTLTKVLVLLKTQIITCSIFHAPFPSIKPQNTSTKEIEKIIDSLKMKNSSGYDEISTKVLKISAPLSDLPCVTSVINSCGLEIFLLG